MSTAPTARYTQASPVPHNRRSAAVARHVPTIAASLCALAALLSPAPGHADDARLAKGEVLVSTREVAGCDLPEVTAQAVVDAPPEKVWRIIDDCNQYKRHMPRVSASKELERKGTTIQCEVTVDMPFPLSDLTAVTQAEHVVGPPRWSRTWKLVRGDYDRNEGAWTLTAFDAAATRTRVTYRLLVAPKTLVPNALVKKAQLSTLRDLMNRLREAVK
ncbi:MAG: hypothetical protein EXR79_06890 [Myxococcales bacterium]|nr:hypothetical protein [Myxococcales bacterium]